jgi:hypothetical protein
MKKWLKLFPCVTITDTRGCAYLIRYYILKTRIISIYVHNILLDDDADMHDHPWWFIVLILKGGYWEQMPGRKIFRRPLDTIFHKPTDIHRIELGVKYFDGIPRIIPSWSLVILGPKVREWGFHTKEGWVYFKNYISKVFRKGC